MMAIVNAARNLVGLELVDGWVVVAEAPKSAGATGGNFSCGYIAERDGQRAFVKALDYSEAFHPSANTPKILQYMTEAFNFEKAILDKCRTTRMRRVALAIADGSVTVPNAGPYAKVDYLIFELADEDARAHLDAMMTFDVAWRLRALHGATIGLRQLHAERIAHQDLKPSNLLEFAGVGTKIGDLGRSARSGYTSPHDVLEVPGDRGYSSPELLYGQIDVDFMRRRLAPDLFMLGSLGYFFFTGTNLTAAILGELHPSHHPNAWSGKYEEVLPYVRDAFDRAMNNMYDACRRVVSDQMAEELVTVIRELADPDPVVRGDAKSKKAHGNPYSLERYVTRFNVLASRIEMKLPQYESAFRST